MTSRLANLYKNKKQTRVVSAVYSVGSCQLTGGVAAAAARGDAAIDYWCKLYDIDTPMHSACDTVC